jgi:hypothetical protein
VFDAPVDVILGCHDVVVPDLVVVTASPQVTDAPSRERRH